MPIYKKDASGKFVIFESPAFKDLHTEKVLETWIEDNPHMLLDGEALAIIARQPRTTFSKFLDLLAVDETGATVVIELKRGETPREVVAQALEYAAWVDSLSTNQLDEMARDYAASKGIAADDVATLYDHTFLEQSSDGADDEESDEEDEADDSAETRVTYNNRQRIVIVAERISDEVEQTLRYLRTRLGADVYGVEFSVHIAGGETLISTTTIVGREAPKAAPKAGSGKQHSVEETQEKVKNDFLRATVAAMDDWVSSVPGLRVERAPRGSGRKVLRKHRRIAYFYFAANWMYAILHRVSESELAALRGGLTQPDTLSPRKGGVHYRFHVTNESDLRLFKKVLEARAANVAGGENPS